jgi:hypothetical protein
MTNPRCQWCIDQDHGSCIVIILCGTPTKGRPERHKDTYWHSKSGPHIFRCGCWCEWARGTKCLKCQMCGVAVDQNMHCVDQVRCFEVQSVNKKLSDPEETIAS